MSTIKPLVYDAANARLAEIEIQIPIGRNLLINAEGLINQRGFAGGALAAGVYGYDRFKAGTGGCNFSVSSGVWTHTSGPIVQVVEAPTGVFGSSVTFSVEDPNTNISVSVGGVSGTITAGSGRRGVTLAIPSGGGNLTVQWSATGATYKRPQLERGSAATAFESRHPALELMLCQRYYEKSFPLDVSPGQNAGLAGASFVSQTTQALWRSSGYFVSFNVVKAVYPAITIFNPLALNAKLRNVAVNEDAENTSVNLYGARGFVVEFDATQGSSYGNPNAMHWTADSEL